MANYASVLQQLKRITPYKNMESIWKEKAEELLRQLEDDVVNYRLMTGDLLDLVESLFKEAKFPEVEDIRVYNSRVDLAENTFFARKSVGNKQSGYWEVDVHCVGLKLVIFVNEI